MLGSAFSTRRRISLTNEAMPLTPATMLAIHPIGYGPVDDERRGRRGAGHDGHQVSIAQGIGVRHGDERRQADARAAADEAPDSACAKHAFAVLGGLVGR